MDGIDLLVHRVASSAVDDGALSNVLAIVDHDSPDVDKGEEGDIGELLEREQERKDVVGQRLGKSIKRVEGVAGVRRGHDPLVVGLVEVLVDLGVVQPAVDPVDAEVGEDNEEGELDDVVPDSRAFCGGVVHLAVSTDLGDEEGRGEDAHDGHGAHGLGDLHGDLVLEIFGVGEGGLVEDEDVGEGCACEVDDETEDPVRIVSVHCQADQLGFWAYHVIRNRERVWRHRWSRAQLLM